MGKKKEQEQPSAPPLDTEHYQQSPANPNVAYPTLSSESSQQTTPVNNPTTPPPVYGATNTPNQTSGYIPQTNQMGPQSSGANNAQSNDAPPSYNDALNCPAPPYLPYGAPKPSYVTGPQNGHPIYPPPVSGTGYVIQAPLDTAQGMPQPQRITTTIITATGANSCIHCYGGEVHNETDLCCLLCLILFAIFTFPLGLILLCCIPCTTRRRCMRCRRLN